MKQECWDPCLYDERHAYVARYGLEVILWLAPRPGEYILDLGCGTGTLTAEIAALGARVTGLDNSEAMLETARKNCSGIEFCHASGTDFTFTEKFDAVFSNAALHWMRPPEHVIACVARCLKPLGRFVGEFGGAGNVAQILAALCQTLSEIGHNEAGQGIENYFPTLDEYRGLLEQGGFKIVLLSHFERLTRLEGGPQGLRNWLRMFRAPALKDLQAAEAEALYALMEKKLRPVLWQDSAWHADYVRLRFSAVLKSTPPPLVT